MGATPRPPCSPPAFPSQDSGVVRLRVADLAVAVVLGLSVDEGGRPAVWAAGCDARGTDLHLEFQRGQR